MTTSISRFVCVVLLLFATTTSCQTGGKSEVAASASEIQPLLPGTEAPDVTFFNTDGSPFTLKEALTEKPVVLIFYRGGW
jgi:cytochrome oxidase Cu insertion factor (SCO1/SenC/PrrC family)